MSLYQAAAAAGYALIIAVLSALVGLTVVSTGEQGWFILLGVLAGGIVSLPKRRAVNG